MNNTKMTYNFSSTLDEDIPRITEFDRKNLITSIEASIFSDDPNAQFKEYLLSIQVEQKQKQLLHSFDNFRKKLCQTSSCIYYSFISPVCTDCLLHTYSINYNFIDNNYLFYVPESRQIYLSKQDFNDLKALIIPQIPQWNFISKDANGIKLNPLPELPEDEIRAFIKIHREFSKNSGLAKYTSPYIYHYEQYQVITYQLARRFFLLCKTTNIIAQTTSHNEQIQKGLSEFRYFLLHKFSLSTNLLHCLKGTFVLTLRNCKSQIVLVSDLSLHPFAKLNLTLYTISGGDTLIIKQLAIMLAKIFIGRKYLKELDPDDNLNHFTIIMSDNPKYIRDFLMNILAYDPSPDNLDYSDPTRENIVQRTKPSEPFYLATEHTLSYLCNKENIISLIKEKSLGNIVNIDTGKTSIESGVFSRILKGRAISYPGDKIFNDKLTYRSNAHYVHICQTINDIDIKGTGKLSYDTIILSGKVYDANYTRLDAYELFFLVTGFLNYGISLLGDNLIAEDVINTKHSIPNQAETISSFIAEFYDDTFELKKASHSQKADSNDFADIDSDIYPIYKKWFNILYKNATICTADYFKRKLKDIYIERKASKNLTCLSKTEQQRELVHRYFKNNKTEHRGVSGLKLNESKFREFLDDFQQILPDDTAIKNAFADYLQEIFEKYSPYNDRF